MEQVLLTIGRTADRLASPPMIYSSLQFPLESSSSSKGYFLKEMQTLHNDDALCILDIHLMVISIIILRERKQ